MTHPSNRLYSLDVYRGLTMFFLMAEAAGVYSAFSAMSQDNAILGALATQFHHHPWNGLRFWDLIQPFFMFIVGVAMPFSLKKRLARGDSWQEAFRHILFRCLMLFLFGTGLHCVYANKLVWELWNVLTQLSFTILVTFLLMRLSVKAQLGVSLVFLILAEVLYRIYDPAAPFVKDQSFGSWIDMILMGKLNNGGGWVTINCLSTAAHTIWGAICGKILLSDLKDRQKIKWFVRAALIALLLGYGLDLAGITPIVKRIATTSFVLVSGGWAILALSFFYWWVDLQHRKKLDQNVQHCGNELHLHLLVFRNDRASMVDQKSGGFQSWIFGMVWTSRKFSESDLGLFHPRYSLVLVLLFV